jgi:hypothetical protein
MKSTGAFLTGVATLALVFGPIRLWSNGILHSADTDYRVPKPTPKPTPEPKPEPTPQPTPEPRPTPKLPDGCPDFDGDGRPDC